MLIHATQEADSVRTPSNDERRAAWAYRYFAQGHHREPIDGCPQPETPIRTRAYAQGQSHEELK